MRKLTYNVTESSNRTQTIYQIEFITDRGAEWTEQQYLRNRSNTKMELISDEETEEEEGLSKEVKLG
tara:strand:+ start:511 stop:711 length:201 start_codon:yes stop_codon:yes gene_type:complete